MATQTDATIKCSAADRAHVLMAALVSLTQFLCGERLSTGVAIPVFVIRPAFARAFMLDQLRFVWIDLPAPSTLKAGLHHCSTAIAILAKIFKNMYNERI